MIVSAWNPPVDELEKTYLAQYAAKNSATLKVKNAARFVNNKMILVGKMAYEQSEILKIDAFSDNTTIVLDIAGPVTTQFPHNTDDPVYLLRYDRVVFFSSATVGGAKTELTNVLIDVANDEEQTIYEDPAGTGTTYYWTKYRNSITGEESAFSDFIRMEDSGEETIGDAIERASRRLKDPGYNVISPEVYMDLAKEVNDDLTPQMERPYGFLHRNIVKDRVAGQAYIELEEDYEKFDYFIINNLNSGILSDRPLIPVPYKQFRRGFVATFTSDTLGNICLDPANNRILIRPTPRTNGTGIYEIGYYAKFLRLKNFSDVVQTPGNTIYYYKFLAEGFSIKAERDPSFAGLAQKYEQKYSNHIVMLQRMNRKDVGSPRDFMSSQRTSSRDNMPRRRYTL
jgi:hypothetical protein